MSTPEPKSLKQTWEEIKQMWAALPKFNKRAIVFAAASFSLLMLVAICSGPNKSSTYKVATKKDAVADSLSRRVVLIKNLNDAGATDYASLFSVEASYAIAEGVMSAHRSVLQASLYSNDVEIKSLAEKAKTRMIAAQLKAYPALRAKWAEMIRVKMWEKDVYVELSGRALLLTWTGFAANKNIADAQGQLAQALSTLRFKHTQYRWYKGQDDWQGYDMQTKADGDISTD